MSLHVVGALEPSDAFYREIFGLAPLPRPPLAIPGTWLDGGRGVHLHLNGRSATPGEWPHPAHLCVEHPDLDGIERALRSAGSQTAWAGTLDRRQLWTRDPAGNVIEVQDPDEGR